MRQKWLFVLLHVWYRSHLWRTQGLIETDKWDANDNVGTARTLPSLKGRGMFLQSIMSPSMKQKRFSRRKDMSVRRTCRLPITSSKIFMQFEPMKMATGTCGRSCPLELYTSDLVCAETSGLLKKCQLLDLNGAINDGGAFRTTHGGWTASVSIVAC